MHCTSNRCFRFGSALLLTMIIVIFPISGQSSAFVGVFGDYETATEAVGAGIQGSYDYRTSVGSSGYLKFTTLGELSYDFPSSDISDLFSVDIENIWFMDEDELAISLGSQFSLSGYDGTTAYFTPDWDLTYRIFRGYRSVNPSFSYYGYATDSQLYNGVQIAIEHAPKVELSYDLSLGGGLDSYYDANRPDFLMNLATGIHGLVGYSINWDMWGETSYRFSDEDTREGFYGSIAGQLMVTPSRLFQVYLAPAWYWSYLTVTETWDMSIEIAARADLALEDSIYLYFGPSFTMDHIQDSPQLETSAAITIGIDVGL